MKKNQDKLEVAKSLALFNQVGIMMITTLGVSVFIGYLIDGWLGTMPLFLMIFLVIGVGAAMRNMYVTLTKGIKTKTKEEWQAYRQAQEEADEES